MGHAVKISWGDNQSRESTAMSYTLWLVKNLIKLKVPDIRIEQVVDKPPTSKEVESNIGKPGAPPKSPKNGFISARGGRYPGQPRFSSKHALNPKKDD